MESIPIKYSGLRRGIRPRRTFEKKMRIGGVEVVSSLGDVEVSEGVASVHLFITVKEGRTGKGIPFAPFIVYSDGREVSRGRCNLYGKASVTFNETRHRADISVYHARKIVGAYDTSRLIWDNFDDGNLDGSVWRAFTGTPSFFVGTAEAYEGDGRINFKCTNTGYLAGIYTKRPIDISDSNISVKLFSDGWVVCAITILPQDEHFNGAGYNKGYDLVVWENGIDKLTIYSGTDRVLCMDSIKGNPDEIKITLDGDEIIFYEFDEEVYREPYKLPTKLCDIYLWGQSWYLFASGTSWADDFLLRAS